MKTVLLVLFSGILMLAYEKANDKPFEKSKPVNQTNEGIAIQGYDTVAYFTDGMPVKGLPQYWVRWHGAVWHFASSEHRDAFFRNPDKYAPQYGGYCAVGVGEGHAAPVDPAVWTIVDGKLYLTYNKEVQQLFLREPESRIQKAEKNWPSLHQ